MYYKIHSSFIFIEHYGLTGLLYNIPFRKDTSNKHIYLLKIILLLTFTKYLRYLRYLRVPLESNRIVFSKLDLLNNTDRHHNRQGPPHSLKPKT